MCDMARTTDGVIELGSISLIEPPQAKPDVWLALVTS